MLHPSPKRLLVAKIAQNDQFMLSLGRFSRVSRWAVALSILLTLVWISPTLGQPADEDGVVDLQEQIRQLQAEVRTLTTQLRDAQRRITVLELQSGNSKDDAQPANAAPADPDAYTLPEGNPLASPEAALQASRRMFDEALGALAIESDRDRVAFFRQAKGWISRTNRELTNRITWTCDIRSVEVLESGAAYVSLRVVDPNDSAAAWSVVHVIEVPRRLATAIRRVRDSNMSNDTGLDNAANDPSVTSTTSDKPTLFRLNGIFHTMLTLDKDRPEEGLFTDPPLVGPFVNFEYTIDVKSMVPVDSTSSDPNGH